VIEPKNITYPTDAKLAIRIINRLNKLAKAYGIQQRRTCTKEVKNLRLAIRHFRHVTRRAKTKKVVKRLRTIARILIRELRRRLPKHSLFEQHQKDFCFTNVCWNNNQKIKINSIHCMSLLFIVLEKAKTTNNMNMAIKCRLPTPQKPIVLLV